MSPSEKASRRKRAVQIIRIAVLISTALEHEARALEHKAGVHLTVDDGQNRARDQVMFTHVQESVSMPAIFISATG